jgi:hypothetical protein
MSLLRSLVDPTVPARTRLLRLVLLGLLLLACGYRVWLVVQFNPMDHIWSDPGRHWNNGTRPLDTSPMAAIDPIMYQLYVGMLAKITAAQPVLVAYWTALLSLSGPWLWYRFLRELFPDRDWALAGWVVFAALPSWSAIYSYFMQETLMLPLLGMALWATWRCRRKADTASFVLAAGIWLAAGLTRGVCMPLGAVAMTWLWLAQGGKLTRAAASAVLVLAIMGPLAGRSWTLVRLISPYGIGQMVHLYHLSGAQSIEIEFTRRGGAERWKYGFTSPAANEMPLAPLSEWQPRREWTANFTIDLDAGQRDWQAARASLPPLDARRLAWLTGDNLIRLFFGSSWPDTNRERVIGEVNHWSRWIWVPLSLGCLVLTLVCWRRQRERMLPALILTWFIVQGLFPLVPNEGRYRKPFEGLLLAQCLLLGATCARVRRVSLDGPPSVAIESPAKMT